MARLVCVRAPVGCVALVAVVAVAGCASGTGHHPGPLASASAPESRAAAAAAAYLGIAAPANHRLDYGFDQLNDHAKADLGRARADLLGIAATERLFDRQLLLLRLPPEAGYFAQFMAMVNEERARLTVTAASSATLAQLRGYMQRLTAANVPVEQAAALIRSQLGLPPPSTS